MFYVDKLTYGSDSYTVFMEDAKNTENVLNVHELEALYLYTECDYKAVRSALTGRNDRTPITNIDALDSAIARAVKRERVLYRGVRVDTTVEDMFTVGEEFTDVSFMSCSASLTVAEKFASMWEESVILRMVTTDGLPLGESTSTKGSSEKEVILPRNTKFVVTKIVKNAAIKIGGTVSYHTVVECVHP